MKRPARFGAPFRRRSRALAALLLLVVSPPAIHATTSPATQTTPARLQPRKTIDKNLAGGATDSYEIEAPAGQFLHVILDQHGIDVALTLFAPGGKQIATMDSPNGSYGLEQISTITDSAGAYRLDVSSSDKSAPPGRYRLTLSPLRPPTDSDRARIEAERMFAEANQAPQTNAASRRQVAQQFEATLPLWHAAGDAYEEALTLNAVGQIYMRLSDAPKALDDWNRALALYRAANDDDGQAAIFTNIALAYDSLGEKQKALDFARQAVPLYRSAGDPLGEATVLNNIGATYSDLGDMQHALDFFNQALPLRRAAGDRDGEASTLNNIGETYSNLGDAPKALDFYTQALALARATGDRFGQAVTLSNIGYANKSLGDFHKALDFYLQSLPILHDLGDRSSEAATLANVGRLYADLGLHEKALDYYNQALPLEQATGDRFGQARTLNGIGHAYDDLADPHKALDYYNQALPLQRAVGDRQGEASTLNSIGALHAAHGESSRALENYTQALDIQRAIGDRPGEASTLNSIGALNAILGHNDAALANYSQALLLAREVQYPMLEAGVSGNLMAFWRDASQPSLAVFFGKQAIEKYQQVRANLRGLDPESQHAFVKSKEKTYRALADLLIAQGRLPEAQQVLDLLKNEEYLDFIRRDAKSAATLTAPVPLTKTEEAASRDYEAAAARVTAVGNEWATLRAKPNRTPEEEKHFAELSNDLKTANEAWGKFLNGLYAELGKSKESQAAVEDVQERASGMQRIVRQLSDQTHTSVVALYTLVGDEKYRVIVVTPAVMVAREYPVRADDLRKKVFAFRESLTDLKSDPVPQAQELYKILVAPIAQDLAGVHAETLMWSLDDVLRYLPVAALHDGHSYLVEKYRNESFTPASEASLTDRPDVAAWRGLGMGISKSYGDFSPLPSVPEELHRIIRDPGDSNAAPTAQSQGVVPGQTMLDEAFTEANMKKALEQNYPLIHIASHFDFEAGNETDSFLLLGGHAAQGERLTLAQLRTDPAFTFADTQLLTLSACNTALTAAVGNGREVDGLGILAQQKGARAVVATLWSVNDRSTGILMQDFYREWTTHDGMPKAEALRLAQIELLHGNAQPYTHPYYWAPFILIGNWR